MENLLFLGVPILKHFRVLLSHDVAVIQWIKLYHKNRMTICVITLWGIHEGSLTMSEAQDDLEAADREGLQRVELSAIDPHDRDTLRSGVRSAMCAASQLPGRGPTVLDIAPVPAR